jgi:hypothetical protein
MIEIHLRRDQGREASRTAFNIPCSDLFGVTETSSQYLEKILDRSGTDCQASLFTEGSGGKNGDGEGRLSRFSLPLFGRRGRDLDALLQQMLVYAGPQRRRCYNDEQPEACLSSGP